MIKITKKMNKLYFTNKEGTEEMFYPVCYYRANYWTMADLAIAIAKDARADIVVAADESYDDSIKIYEELVELSELFGIEKLFSWPDYISALKDLNGQQWENIVASCANNIKALVKEIEGRDFHVEIECSKIGQ